MSVETLLFLVLLMQVALLVAVHRSERRSRDAIGRAQTQNARWLSDIAESLRRELRQYNGVAPLRAQRDGDREGREAEHRERARFWEDISED